MINSTQTEQRELPVFWCTQQGIKELLKKQQDKNEHAGIKQLEEIKDPISISCRMYMESGLTREWVRRMLSALSYDRMLQVTLGTPLSATRFKMLEGNKLTNVKCPRCGGRGSWGRCKMRHDIQAPTHKGGKLWMGAMGQIMNRLCTPNPALNDKFIEKG